MAKRTAKATTKRAPKKAPMTRSEVMRAVKSKNTRPELLVMACLKDEKIKFSTHAKLPGQPDIVLSKRKIAIRVMGCFWHGHSCKNGNRVPRSNIPYWTAKIKRNVMRDRENLRDLKKLGWQVINIWECGLRKVNWKEKLIETIMRLTQS